MADTLPLSNVIEESSRKLNGNCFSDASQHISPQNEAILQSGLEPNLKPKNNSSKNIENETRVGIYFVYPCDFGPKHYLILGCRDRHIKVLRYYQHPGAEEGTWTLRHTIPGHTGSVLCVYGQMTNQSNFLISSSSDSTIRFWDWSALERTYNEVNVIREHKDAVLHFRYLDGYLLAGSKDGRLSMWQVFSPRDVRPLWVVPAHDLAVNVAEFCFAPNVWSNSCCLESSSLVHSARPGALEVQHDPLSFSPAPSTNEGRTGDSESGGSLYFYSSSSNNSAPFSSTSSSNSSSAFAPCIYSNDRFLTFWNSDSKQNISTFNNFVATISDPKAYNPNPPASSSDPGPGADSSSLTSGVSNLRWFSSPSVSIQSPVIPTLSGQLLETHAQAKQSHLKESWLPRISENETFPTPLIENLNELSPSTSDLTQVTYPQNKHAILRWRACPARYAVSGGGDRQIQIFESESGKRVLRLMGHKRGVTSLALPSAALIESNPWIASMLVTGGADCDIRIWNLDSGVCTATIKKAHTDFIRCLAIGSNRLHISASLPSAPIADTPTPVSVKGDQHLSKCSPDPIAPGSSSCMNSLASAAQQPIESKEIEHFQILPFNELAANKLSAPCAPHSNEVSAKSDNSALADTLVTIEHMPPNHTSAPVDAEKSQNPEKLPDLAVAQAQAQASVYLASGSYDGRVSLWILNQTGEVPSKPTHLHRHSSHVYALHFEGTQVVSCSADNTVAIGDLSTLEHQGHSSSEIPDSAAQAETDLQANSSVKSHTHSMARIVKLNHSAQGKSEHKKRESSSHRSSTRAVATPVEQNPATSLASLTGAASNLQSEPISKEKKEALRSDKGTPAPPNANTCFPVATGATGPSKMDATELCISEKSARASRKASRHVRPKSDPGSSSSGDTQSEASTTRSRSHSPETRSSKIVVADSACATPSSCSRDFSPAQGHRASDPEKIPHKAGITLAHKFFSKVFGKRFK